MGLAPSADLLAGLYAPRDLDRYFIRMRCGPQPGMRAVVAAQGKYGCWRYDDYAWNCELALTDRSDALTWWLADPWLPNQQFEYGILADGAGLTAEAEEARLSAERWAEVASALAFQVVTTTGVQPHEVGPDSTETGALVYRRMRDRRAAAHIHWYEGRSRFDDLRGSCPVRTDIPPMLRCVVLAEAQASLSRRPHIEAYIGIDEAPAGVAADAAATLKQFDLPRRIYHLLLR